MEGYIKLHRQILENDLWLSERFTKSQAWIDLLILARHKPGMAFIRGIQVNLQPGELCYSQESLAARWKWDRKTVKKFLEWLKTRGQIDFRGDKLTTIITIINWLKYQHNPQQNYCNNESNSQDSGIFRQGYGEQNGQQNPQQKDIRIPTNKNDKNVKKEYSPNSPEFRLSLFLYETIHMRDNKFKQPDLNKWALHIERLMRIDERSEMEIEGVIKWSQKDSFWQSNILSTQKLREKFQTLYLQMTSAKTENKNQGAQIHNSYNNNGSEPYRRLDL